MATRKLSAIMFTDIVGYTSMMADNEQTALNAVAKNREIQQAEIARHDGTWLKQMGDGTLSSFDSAINAVNCAIAIQENLRDNPEFKIRIGIHLGDVVFTESDVYGNGVNIASRVEPMAAAGGVAISGQVRDTLIGSQDVDLVYLGEKDLKHVSQPIKIFAVNSHDLPVPAVDPSMVGTTQTVSEKSGYSWGKVAASVVVIVIVLLLINRNARRTGQEQIAEESVQPVNVPAALEVAEQAIQSDPEPPAQAVETESSEAQAPDTYVGATVASQQLSVEEVGRQLGQAVQEFGNRQFVAAENTLLTLAETNPVPEVSLLYGVVLATVGRINAALPYLEQAHAGNSRPLESATWLADVLLMQNRPAEAENIVDAALAGNSADNSEYRVRLQLLKWESVSQQGRTLDRQILAGFDPEIRRVIGAMDNLAEMIERNPRAAINRIRTRAQDADIQPETMALLIQTAAGEFDNPELSMRVLERSPNVPLSIWDDVYSSARQTQLFKNYAGDNGLLDYWQGTGSWPDSCRPLEGSDDFECF